MQSKVKPVQVNLRGFTLIEMSLVLVIIGLLVAGVLTGKELIHTAKLHQVVSELNSIQVAINNFRAKYDGLPGDLKKAPAFWPTGQWNPGLPAFDAAGLPALPTGQGLWWYAACADQCNTWYAYYEGIWAWQQMALAGLLPGPYKNPSTGTKLAQDSSYIRPGLHLFPSKFQGGAGYVLNSTVDWYDLSGAGTPDTPAFPGLQNYIVLGDFSLGFNPGAQVGPGWGNNALLSPEDASIIDRKMDDGFAMSGHLIAEGGAGMDCITYNEHAMSYGGGSVAHWSSPGDYNLAPTYSYTTGPGCGEGEGACDTVYAPVGPCVVMYSIEKGF